MRSQDIAIVGIFLALGVLARIIGSSLIPTPIGPNFVIILYCLAIMLIVPKFHEAVGIGVVVGIVSTLISHGLFPPANLISETLGAVVCLGVFLITRERTVAAPATATLAATLVSGITFLSIVIIFVMGAPGLLYRSFSYSSIYAFFTLMMITIVIPTAVLNAVVAQILYIPANRVLSRSR
ncbi:tryptophan transporter [uncultured Methanospirillum sp.]|uniref:tryptophan transporter n=1 Tax=uncultured Methanospirillum sp. TaxID=262503 RepID=UPI0029C72EC9|nr:tryptophan transporter [uncultured Methanospirillum sp.]